MPETIEIDGQTYRAICTMRASGEQHVIYLPDAVAMQANGERELNLFYSGPYIAPPPIPEE